MNSGRPRSRTSGMTLVEVLMVVFIIGLVTMVVVLTLPPREDPYERAFRKVQDTIAAVHDRAMMTGEVLGLSPQEDRIDIVSWTGTEWQPAARQSLALPANARLEIVRERADRNDGAPSVIIFNPLGVTQPVRIDLHAGMRVFALQLTEEGRLERLDEL